MRLPILRSTNAAEQRQFARLPKPSEREAGVISGFLSTSAAVDVTLRAEGGLYANLKTTAERKPGAGRSARRRRAREGGASATQRQASNARVDADSHGRSVCSAKTETSPTTHVDAATLDVTAAVDEEDPAAAEDRNVVRAARAYMRSTAQGGPERSISFADGAAAERLLAAPSSTMTPHSYRARALQQKELRVRRNSLPKAGAAIDAAAARASVEQAAQRASAVAKERTALLSVELDHSALVVAGIAQAEADRLAEFRRDLPHELLFRKGMEKYRNANAFDLISSVGAKLRAAGRKEGFSIWKRWVVHARAEERHDSARVLQRSVRHLYARRELSLRRRLIMEQLRREAQIAKRRRAAALRSSFVLQRTARTWRAHRELTRRRIERAAAIRLQGVYRRHDSERVMHAMFELRDRRLAGARLLQRAYRGRLARRFVAVKQRLLGLEQQALLIAQAREQREETFRRSGATYEIQIAWRQHRRVQQLKMVLRAKKWMSALIAQCAVRVHVAKCEVRRRVRKKCDLADAKVAAACKVQSVRRGQLARARVTQKRADDKAAMLARRAHKRDSINRMRDAKWNPRRKAANLKFATTSKRRKNAAARTLQSAWRSHHGRTVVKRKKIVRRSERRAEKLQRMHAMARRLQKNWRRKLKRGRSNQRRAVKAAKTLQRSYRASTARRKAEELESHEIGATTMQCYLRRHLARRAFFGMKVREVMFGVHVVPIQHVARRWIAARRELRAHAVALREAENLNAGAACFWRSARDVNDTILIAQFHSKRARLTKDEKQWYAERSKTATPASAALRGVFCLFTNDEVGMFEFTHWKTLLKNSDDLLLEAAKPSGGVGGGRTPRAAAEMPTPGASGASSSVGEAAAAAGGVAATTPRVEAKTARAKARGEGRLLKTNKAELVFSKHKTVDTKELTCVVRLACLAHHSLTSLCQSLSRRTALARLPRASDSPCPSIARSICVFNPRRYRQFVAALREVAQLRYPGPQFARPRSGSCKEHDARLLKLCVENIFCKPMRKEKGGKKKKAQHAYVKKSRKELAALASDVMADAQGVIKRNCYTLWRRRKVARLARRKMAEERYKARLDAAAAKMQGLYRARSGRRMLLALVRRHILKFAMEGGDGEESYYFNTRTGVTSWDKPLLLGDSDVKMTQKVADEDTEFVIVCCVCDADPGTAVGTVAAKASRAGEWGAPKIARRAEIHCQTGNFCRPCYTTFNSRGKRATQTHSVIPLCTSCNYQTATRRMVGVGESTLCDTCFINYRISAKSDASCLHKKIVCPCSECGEFAARWLCHDCGDDFCHACFGAFHRRGARMRHTYERLDYYTATERTVKHRALAAKVRPALCFLHLLRASPSPSARMCIACCLSRAHRPHAPSLCPSLPPRTTRSATRRQRRSSSVSRRQTWRSAARSSRCASRQHGAAATGGTSA
jgi:hypothetical protein